MKYRNILASTLILATLFTNTVFASTGFTNTNGVNIREGASTQSKVVTTLNKGERLEITGVNNGFYSVNRNGKTYYVSADYTKITKADGVVKADGVFIRKAPSLTAETVGMLGLNTKVSVVGQSGDWYQLQDGDKYAYIHKDFITGDLVSKVGAPIAATTTSANTPVSTYSGYYKVNAEGGLNIRSGASESSSKVGMVPNGTIVSGLDTVNGFTKINYNGTVGYVKASFISSTTQTPASNVATVSSSSTGTQIVEWAKQYIGTPYKYGGTSLTSGVDCSGFVYSVFKQNPYKSLTVNRVADAQYNNGTRVSKSELLPGDIVVFDTSGPNTGVITHSGIYAGNGKFIHSSSGSAYSVTVSDLTTGFYLNAYVGGTRVLN